MKKINAFATKASSKNHFYVCWSGHYFCVRELKFSNKNELGKGYENVVFYGNKLTAQNKADYWNDGMKNFFCIKLRNAIGNFTKELALLNLNDCHFDNGDCDLINGISRSLDGFIQIRIRGDEHIKEYVENARKKGVF